jgi:hypothetical protein
MGNAMPKSGSHLIIQVLEGLSHLGPFVNPGFPPVNRFEDNSKLSEKQILAEIRNMLPGDVRYGYLHAEEPWISALTGPDRATVFVYRDPRDWVVSQVLYASEMHAGHMMHQAYNRMDSMEARINLAIEGGPASGSLPGGTDVIAPPLAERYAHYTAWLDTPGVLCLRFEDLILEQAAALARILEYLETFGFQPALPRPQAVEVLARGIAPGRSGTFRKGQPGNWREHFTSENVRRFKSQAGDLLLDLGYEKSPDWDLYRRA